MFKLVNGYPCNSGCDVRLAKQGIDPRNPHKDPVKQKELDARDPAKAAEALRKDKADDSAVLFAGALAGFNPAQTAPTAAPPTRRLDMVV